ncbi:MAG: hypothetical protein KIT84_39855 [Labilithrix sp.]|nr:hypothetical protein [Labilithrix sp.]MCW5817220.1 hypothetical protein [Labilithrix sp.]
MPERRRDPRAVREPGSVRRGRVPGAAGRRRGLQRRRRALLHVPRRVRRRQVRRLAVSIADLQAMRRVVAFGAVAALGLSTLEAHAQNYREMPIGGRTATMGGAGTAAGNDSAMPYLNPAGLAGVPGDIFAVSAAAYSYTRRSFTNVMFPSGVPASFGFQQDSASFATSTIGELPSSVMYFRHFGDLKAKIQHRLGISLVIPGARDVELIGSVGGRYTAFNGRYVNQVSATSQQRSYYLGPSYAIALNPDLRLGLSLYGLYQRNQRTRAQQFELSGFGGALSGNGSGQLAALQEAFSIAPILGAQARLFSKLWAGLGVALPAIHVTGRERSNGTIASTRDGRSLSAVSQSDLGYFEPAPARLNAGIAWEDRKGFSAAVDVHVYLPRDFGRRGTTAVEARQTGEVSRRQVIGTDESVERELVVDVSAGVEYAFTSLLSTRLGFFTDNPPRATLDASDRDNGQLTLQRFGGTLGLGIQAGSFDTTLGLVFARGTGRYVTVDQFGPGGAPGFTTVPTTETTSMIVFSGAVTVDEAKKAIRDALPVAVPLPDLEIGGTGTPAPWIPDPLPPEPKPPPPKVRRAVPEMIEPRPPAVRP